MFAVCVLTLSLLATPARDAPVVKAKRVRAITPRANAQCEVCAFGWAERTFTNTPPLVQRALSPSMIFVASPLSREPREADSLSAVTVEMRDVGFVASARQQGQTALWGELNLADEIIARGYGFPVGGSTSLGWYGAHRLEVRSLRTRAPFLFVSLENNLRRDPDGIRSLSALPGFGFGVLFPFSKTGALTLTSGANAGAWLDVRNGSLSPGFALNLTSASLRL
ncbi:MAG: hypothetical protein QM817_37070 [Archangium sp.]